MRVTVRAVQDLARNAGFPEEVIHRYSDELIKMTFAVAKRERKQCVNKVRAWVHSGDVVKPNITDVLTNKMENEEELYDLL